MQIILIILILVFWISPVMADEAYEVFKSLGEDDTSIEDGICTFGNQQTMCHEVLLPEYPNFVYYVIYNKRVVGNDVAWVPIVIKKCSLDLSLQKNIWQNTGEEPPIPAQKQRELNV